MTRGWRFKRAVACLATLVLVAAPIPVVAGDATWATPTILSRGWDNSSYSSLALAMGTEDNATIAWIQRAEGGFGLETFLAQHTSTSGWLSPYAVGCPTSGSECVTFGSEPSVSVDRSGRILIGYVGPNLSPTVWSYDPASGNSAGDVKVFDPYGAQTWQVWAGSDGRGDRVAVWQRLRPNPLYAGVQDEIWVTTYQPATGWQTPFRMAGTNDTTASDATLAVGFDGSAILAWLQWTYGSVPPQPVQLVVARYDPLLGWGAPALLAGDANTSVMVARAGTDSVGRTLVVWTTDEHAILASRYVPGEGWSAPVLVSAARPEGGWHVRLAVSPLGSAIAIWDRGFELWSSRYAPSTGWSPEERVVALPQPPYVFDVGTNSSGIAAAAWAYGGVFGAVDTRGTVAGAVSANGSGWEPPSVIGTMEASSIASSIRVSVDSHGTPTVVWVQAYGPDDGVWTSSLAGPVTGSLIPVLLVVGAGGAAAVVASVLLLRRRRRKHG